MWPLDFDIYSWGKSKCKSTSVQFNKYDKVLVRDSFEQNWNLVLFSHYNFTSMFPFVSTELTGYKHCIFYEGNEHLLGTSLPYSIYNYENVSDGIKIIIKLNGKYKDAFVLNKTSCSLNVFVLNDDNTGYQKTIMYNEIKDIY